MSDPNQNNSQNTEDNSELYPHEQRHDRHQPSVPSPPTTPSSRDEYQIVSFSGAYALCIDVDVSTHTCTIESDPDMSADTASDGFGLTMPELRPEELIQSSIDDSNWSVERESPVRGTAAPTLLYDVYEHFGLLTEIDSIWDVSLLVRHPRSGSHVRVEADDTVRSDGTVIVPETWFPRGVGVTCDPRSTLRLLALDPTHQSTQWL